MDSTKFSPENLRLSQDFASTGAVKKQLVKVPVRKPRRQEFVRVRPGEEWRVNVFIIEDEVGGEVYIIDPSLHETLLSEGKPVWLFTAVNRQGDVFLWRVNAPGPDGRSNDWNDTALEAAELAAEKWVRVSANMGAGMYDVATPQNDLGDPKWPDQDFPQLLEKAFGNNHYIDDLEHPFLQRLRGEQ